MKLRSLGASNREKQKIPKAYEKAYLEFNQFIGFAKRAGWPIDVEKVENRLPPEPDILCSYLSGERVAFELFEICDSKIANPRSFEASDFVRTGDPTRGLIKKKLGRKYNTPYPVELICYTNGRVISPDDVIVETLRPIVEVNMGPFRRVWFFGEDKVEIVAEL